MLGVALGLGSSVCWGVADFIGGLLARRISVLTVLYVSQIAGLVLAFGMLVFLAGDGLATDEAWAAAGGGALGALALGAFYRALAIGPVSVVATLASLGVIVPVAVGLARGESPEEVQAAGMVLAVAGSVLVARESSAERRRANRTAVLLALLAALGFGIFFVGIDGAADSDAAWAVAAARSGGVGVLLLASPLLRPDLRAAKPYAAPLASIGLFDVSANALLAVATTHGLLSLVAPSASLYPVVTVILARIYLKERVPAQRAVAIAIALSGVVLIASGS